VESLEWGQGLSSKKRYIVAQALEFKAVKAGDVQARLIIERSARYLGLSLVNAINLLNPELILLGGMFAQEKEINLPVVRKVVNELAFAGLGNNLKIQETGFGWK
jgi:predicted NBD/HSP70 family sugar kinase